jgi:hypothetical protein
MRVSPQVSTEQVRAELANRYTFNSPIPLDAITENVINLLRAWTVHVTHPRYFGLFNPSVRQASIIADALVALYNPQLAAWSHAPAANELEQLTLRHFAHALGLDKQALHANFTTGGAEANLSAVLAALVSRVPGWNETGFFGQHSRPAIYLTGETHHSFVKIARMTGLGTDALREIPTDSHLRMDVDALQSRIEADRASGWHPLLLVGTAGTTSAGKSTLLLLVIITLVATTLVRGLMPRVSLLLIGLGTLLAGIAFGLQATIDIGLSTSTLLQGISPNLLFTTGLAVGSIMLCYWLTRPVFSWIERIVLLGFSLAALVGLYLQFASADFEVAKHVYLLIALIVLIQGVLVAVVSTVAQICRQTWTKAVSVALGQSGLPVFLPHSSRLSPQVVSSKRCRLEHRPVGPTGAPPLCRVCSFAYGPGLDQRDCPPQPSSIRPVARQSVFSRSSLGAAANATRERSCDAR